MGNFYCSPLLYSFMTFYLFLSKIELFAESVIFISKEIDKYYAESLQIQDKAEQ